MTKTIKKSLALILSVLMLVSVMPMSFSLAAETSGLSYSYAGNNSSSRVATVTGYTGSATEVEIPDTTTSRGYSYKVTTIGSSNNRPFQNKTDIKKITLGNNVQTIAANAFVGCTNLETVVLPKSLNSVGNSAFNNCSKLTTVNYTGTGAEWNALVEKLGTGNDSLKNATVNLNYGHDCATGHILNAIAAVEANCSTDGKVAYWTCEVYNCKKNFSDANGRTEITDMSTLVIPAGHLFTNYVSNNDATCIADGTETATCDRNGCNETHTRTDEGSVLGHDMADATCILPSTCRRCGHTEGAALGHKPGQAYIPGVTENPGEWDYAYRPPTCGSSGYQEVIYCTVCRNPLKDYTVIEALGHDFRVVSGTYPTCEEAGHLYYECARAGCTETNDDEPAALEHLFPEEWTVTTPATCSEAGVASRVCTRDNCKETETKVVNPLNHVGTTTTETEEDKFAGNCVIPASYYKVITCACGEVLSREKIENTTVNKEIHVGSSVPDKENEQAGNCVTKATWDLVTRCSSCKDVLSSEPKVGEKAPDTHVNLVKTNAVAPDCETDGNIDYWTCEGCEKIYSDAQATTEITLADIIDPKTGHDYSEWEYDEESEEHKRVCANNESHIEIGECADVETDTDCLCDVCGHLIAHKFATATCFAPKTCTVCNAIEGTVNAENHVGEEFIEIEDYVAGTCSTIESYKIVTYCSGCGAPKDVDSVVGELNPENHIFTEEVVPNNGKDKLHYVDCTECELRVYTDHDLSLVEVYEAATCKTTGRYRAHCSKCKSYIYWEMPIGACVDVNKDYKCDVCGKALEKPSTPEADKPAEDNNNNNDTVVTPETCTCNCHAKGIKGLFFSLVLLFQRLLGLNKKCICGENHY